MNKQSYKFLCIYALLSIIFIFIGCENCQGPEGPQGEPGNSVANIAGYLRCNSIEPWGEAQVTVLNLNTIPSVAINDQLLPHGLYSWAFYDFNFPIEVGDSAHLEVSYIDEDGNARLAGSTVVIPGIFSIIDTDPDTNVYGVIALQPEDDFSVWWSNSAYADAYSIDLYLYCDYNDSLGNDSYYNFYFDTLITDTNITFPSEQLFPPDLEVTYINYLWGQLNILALNGAWQTGAEGNITGDGVGFFYGVFELGYLLIDNDFPPSSDISQPREKDILKFMEKITAKEQ